MAVTGYAIQIDHRVYEGWRDGRPFTLAEAWRETYGVGRARILRPDGTELLHEAGAVSVRVEIGELGRWQRMRARARRAGRLTYVDGIGDQTYFRRATPRPLP